MPGTAEEFFEFVRKTPNSPEGADSIVEQGREALTALDWEITNLFDQRHRVRNLSVRFAQVGAILRGESLLTKEELREIVGRPTAVATGDSVKREVLDVARESGDPVSVADIAEELRKRLWGQSLPWSNPQAAIGTILYQSGDWLRVERGVFTRKEDTISPDDLPF